MEKLLPMEGIFEILQQNSFHQPKNQFPLARMKGLLKISLQQTEKSLAKNGKKWFPPARKSFSTSQNVSKLHFHQVSKKYQWQKCLKIDKKAFPLARKSLSTNRNAFKSMFPLDGKIKAAVAGVSQNGSKKWFPLARKSVSTSRNKVIFQKFDFLVPTNK